MLLRTAQSGGNDDEAIEFNGPISNLPFQIMVLVSLTLITFSFSPSTCSSSYIPLPSPLLLLLPPLQSSCSLSFLPTLSRIYRRWAWYCWWLSLVHKSWQSLNFQLLLTVKQNQSFQDLQCVFYFQQGDWNQKAGIFYPSLSWVTSFIELCSNIFHL